MSIKKENEYMINEYYLPGLNGNSQSVSLQNDITNKNTPKIYLFLTNADAFYDRYCRNLDDFKLREKRFLDFETPNRALITHEYDIEISDNFEYKDYYYLFNPRTRLSWLKISQEGKRLSVAGEKVVKSYIKEILQSELLQVSISFDEIWENKIGLPCFIKLEKGQYKNFLLTASYYDSIKQNEPPKCFFLKSIFSPLMERRIKYDYLPLKGKSSWLYIKAPNNFNFSIDKENIETQDVNTIDYANSGKRDADPSKLSLTIINKEDSNKESSNNLERNVVSLNFSITVPSPLKVWFLSIYYIAIAILIMLCITVGNEIWLYFLTPRFNIERPIILLFENKNFDAIIMGVVAAVITTRSWLISEETITRYYSIYLTRIMALILILYVIVILLQ